MVYIKWDSKKFSVNDTTMDNQHQQLISYLNELYEINVRDSNHEVIDISQVKNIINNLIEYTKIHFQEEEDLMTQMEFPGLSKHKLAHKTLYTQVEYIKEEFDRKGTTVIYKLLAFLGVWLQGHICSLDKEYADFAKQNLATKS